MGKDLLVETVGLAKSYETRRVAVDHSNLSVRRGEVHGSLTTLSKGTTLVFGPVLLYGLAVEIFGFSRQSRIMEGKM